VGKKYSENQSEDVVNEKDYMRQFEQWVTNFTEFVAKKGKVQPGKHRAYGFKQPPHLWNEIKSGIRAFKLRFGIAPPNSSPEKQMIQNLNRNKTRHPKKTEGKKLRE
jgi:sulfur relay (sulfurtransferase) DsrC/TusE family protein